MENGIISAIQNKSDFPVLFFNLFVFFICFFFFDKHFLEIFSLYFISKTPNQLSTKSSLILKHHSEISIEMGFFSGIKTSLSIKKPKDFVKSFLSPLWIYFYFKANIYLISDSQDWLLYEHYPLF